MWIDADDWQDELERRRRAGILSSGLATQVERFAHDGYVILPGAAAEADVRRFEEIISNVFTHGDERVIAQVPEKTGYCAVTPGMSLRGARIIDSHALFSPALDLFSSPRLVEFLTAIFGEPPLLFQSISFHNGSEQGLHQDTAYVVVSERPMELAACWIALEDIRPGSGELTFARGSHRLPEFTFGDGETKHWDPQKHGVDQHNVWSRWLIEECERRGFNRETFIANRGDILVWHADLAHGGSPVQDPKLTRKSLVGHYCPASAKPLTFKFAPQRAKSLPYKNINYASFLFDL
jgi:hypothetical protein